MMTRGTDFRSSTWPDCNRHSRITPVPGIRTTPNPGSSSFPRSLQKQFNFPFRIYGTRGISITRDLDETSLVAVERIKGRDQKKGSLSMLGESAKACDRRIATRDQSGNGTNLDTTHIRGGDLRVIPGARAHPGG